MWMRRWKFLLLAAFAAFAGPAAAQNYPSKPVHVIISFTPGSSTDIVGRIVIQKLTELWGQPVVPDNRAGAGSGTHLTTEKFLAASGVKVTEVPFKGTPEVIGAMFSGDVQAYWAPISAAMALIKGGKLRPLAVSTAKRNPQLPDVPTPAEAGAKGAESPLWFGLWGPGGMDSQLVRKINADVRKSLADAA